MTDVPGVPGSGLRPLLRDRYLIEAAVGAFAGKGYVRLSHAVSPPAMEKLMLSFELGGLPRRVEDVSTYQPKCLGSCPPLCCLRCTPKHESWRPCEML